MGAAGATPPAWAARIAYAERFGVEPHTVNPPLNWWLRLGALDRARVNLSAREAVETRGLDKVSDAERERYNALMIEIKHG